MDGDVRDGRIDDGHTYYDEEAEIAARAREAAVDAMLDEAERTGKWLYSQSLAGTFWFSPAELRELRANGRFRWAAENWSLRDPEERLEQFDRAIADAQEARDHFAKRVTASRHDKRET